MSPAIRDRMGFREFDDGHGGQWRVWDTVPVRANATERLRSGWLTFDNGSERRRLAPIPPGWDQLADERLALLLRVAQASASRGSDDASRVREIQVERRESEPREQERLREQEGREHERREHERREQERRHGERRRGWS